MDRNGRKRGGGVKTVVLVALAILVVLFFLIPAMVGTHRYEGVSSNVINAIEPGPKTDEEYLRVVRMKLDTNNAQDNGLLEIALVMTPRHIDLIVREMLVKAQTTNEVRAISDYLLILDERMHQRAGLTTIDYSKEMADVLAGRNLTREEFVNAWQNRVEYLKGKFGNRK
jgi:hypothetical protein